MAESLSSPHGAPGPAATPAQDQRARERALFLERLYANRFDAEASRKKGELWKVLIERFLQRYVASDGSVLDIAGGSCEFINQVRAREKHVIDLDPRVASRAAPGVRVHALDLLGDLGGWPLEGHFDHVFVSNLFEHLETRDDLVRLLRFCHASLKPGGSLLVLQPNFKYAFREYFDFIDHVLPITERSLAEALLATGFRIETLIPRFLPYTTKGRSSSPLLLRVYLGVPLLWRVFGGQIFVKAVRPAAAASRDALSAP